MPLMAVLGWYNIVYATFALWEALLAGAPPPPAPTAAHLPPVRTNQTRYEDRIEALLLRMDALSDAQLVTLLQR